MKDEAEKRQNQFINEFNFFSPYCPWRDPRGICNGTQTECLAQTCAMMFWMAGLTANLASQMRKIKGDKSEYGVPEIVN